VWLHASPSFIATGDFVLPPSESGLSPQWLSDPAGVQRAEDFGTYRSDRVSIFDSEGVEAQDHIDRFSFVTPASYIYEVEPIGPLEPDPAYFTFRFCLKAQVLRCLYAPSRSGPAA
jgi:hypothetical protein